MTGKLTRILKAIARFANGANKDMAADRPGGAGAARREREENRPPDWQPKDLGY